VSEREIQVQHLLGKKARDAEGRIVGRIEELLVENRDGEFVVTEYHLGPAAVIERIAGAAGQLPLLKHIPRGPRVVYCVRWDQMDLSDLDHPRVTVRSDQLERRTTS
jgi:hypothetical protein